MKVLYKIFWAFCMLLTACAGREDEGIDLLMRSRVDMLNKQSFQARYENPVWGIALADSAIRIVADSLPEYYDGMLRASNNWAYNAYMLADFATAESFLVDSLAEEDPWREASNYPIEKVISQLLRARMEQRHCKLAESYTILYEIDRSKALERHRHSYLYDFAQMEYFITSLMLNYHYRNGALDNVEFLLSDIEAVCPSLKCDYAQEMALNYSLAHSYYRLCDTNEGRQSEMLRKSLQYCFDNQRLLSHADRYCSYHFANVLQMLAFLRSDADISDASWLAVSGLNDSLFRFMDDHFTVRFDYQGDLTAQLFDCSTEMFWQMDDPYQKIGAVVAAADFYYLPIGDYEAACEGYARILEDDTLVNPVAPKFEAMLFAGLINARYSDNPDDLRRWFNRGMEIQQYISRNEKADFILQQELQESRQANRIYFVLLLIIAVTLVGLLATVLLLRRRTLQLREDKLMLEDSKRKDIERIAHVETCLSVMRHDISPFISYLQNKNLPEELRKEVLAQLIRTFDNIKNWTNLSIPSGLHFQAAKVPVQQLFDEAAGNCMMPLHEGVALRFIPSDAVVNADPHLVVVLLRNLVNNALQHTSSGSVTVHAQPYEADGRFVEVQVQDTGCGMTEEELDNLFRADKKIQQNAASPEGYGSGFGLILCRYIIKKHDDNTLRGCRLWAESSPGEGTVFHFLLEQVV